MNASYVKDLIYLLFIATIFYFIVGIVFKIIKFKKLSKLKKGIYFSVFILLFYFFYKVIPSLLFGKTKVVESMTTMMDELSKKSTDDANKKSDTGSGDIDYTKGWDTADNFRANYCSKTPIFVEANWFDSREKEMGNSQGGLIYGGRSELYDSTTKEMNKKFAEELMKQQVDFESFTKENGCLTNIRKDIATDGLSHMCYPKCNWSFKKKSENKK
jgi:hypothetical protein